MNYAEKFKELNGKKALIPFTVLGDPDVSTSVAVIKAMVDGGADILELGFPFSDPIADGPTIQSADIRSLDSGFNTDKGFEILEKVRGFTDVPIGLLVYYNIVLQYGVEKFYSKCKEIGVNGVLIADMPVEESDEIVKTASSNDLETIFIVSPLTTDERVKKISAKTTGFIYVIARLGVTGARDDMESGTLELLKRIRPLTDVPLCVGFGISKKEHVQAVYDAGADGAIVGSAIVKVIEKNLSDKKRMVTEINKYVKSLKV